MSDTSGNEMGRSWGNKLRGAWNTVEGAGDKLRGGAMDFVDSATGTGGHHTETDVGNQKTQAGMAEVRGDGSGSLGAAPQSAATGGTGTTAVAGPTATTGPAPTLPARGGGVSDGTAPVTGSSTGIAQ